MRLGKVGTGGAHEYDCDASHRSRIHLQPTPLRGASCCFAYLLSGALSVALSLSALLNSIFWSMNRTRKMSRS